MNQDSCHKQTELDGDADGVVRVVPSVTNRDLLLPYALPYLAYVAVASVSDGRFPAEWSYLVRLLLVPPLLLWAWRWYVPLRGPRSPWGSAGLGMLVGVVGCVAWIGLLQPFVAGDVPAWGAAAFGLRLVAATLVVPLFEELFVRGFVLRLAYQWDLGRRQGAPEPLAAALDERSIWEVPPGALTLPAAAISVVVFAAGHSLVEWPASLVFGALMVWLWRVRGDLLSCVVAHAVANLALAIYVWQSGAWGLW